MALNQPVKPGKNSTVVTTAGSLTTQNEARQLAAQLFTPSTAPGQTWIAVTLADGTTRVVDGSTITTVTGS